MTGSIRIFEKSHFTPKLSVLVFLKVKLPNMTDWHNCRHNDIILSNNLKFGRLILADLLDIENWLFVGP